MSTDVLERAEKKMDKTVQSTRQEFSSVRTGKASPALLDTVQVEAYGSRVPLNQVANVSAPDTDMLLVQPYDGSIAGEIASAIRTADLGLNPSADGNVVRVPVPPLSEERRKEMAKVLQRMAEEGRVAVRQIRQDAKNELQSLEREGEISEDQYHRRLEALQELTDEHTRAIDAMLEKKEAEVMEV